MHCKNGTATALAVISVACLMALVPMMNGIDVHGETTYDKDYGTFYSYTLQFVFDGADAETIEWDFGDGSAVSNEWNPSHTYEAKGEYIVTQTTTNSYNGGSTTIEKYRVVIAGFPVLSFESNGGSSVTAIEQTAYNVVAERPADPTREGHTFDGWYTDSSLTNAVDWSSGVTRSMTLYAKWTEVPTEPVDPVDPVEPVDPVDPVDPTDPTDPTGTFTVTFDVAGGSVSIPSEDITAGEYVLPGYIGSKDGFEFGGWSIDGTVHAIGERITISGDVTLTAVWTPVSETPDDPKDEPEGEKKVSDTTVYLAIALLVLIIIAVVLYRYYGRGW